MEARGWKKRWYRTQVRGPIARRIMVGHGRANNVGVKPFAEEEDDMVVDYHGQWHSNTDVMLEASSYRILSPS
jgi:hypothetical protein